MCGIFGIIGQLDNSPHIARVMGRTMANRGPDGDGFFFAEGIALGMRRLSIIDLAHGWQPLYARNKRVIAFQNGEIYNYQKLRCELESKGYVFLTQSDTEVLAHGFDAWGMHGLLQRLDGMFATAILDLDQRVFFLGRDRFGEKPLFFCRRRNWFAYSSDLLTLAALPGMEGELDSQGLERYLALHFVPGEKTIFKDIGRITPGEWMSVPLDDIQNVRRSHYFRQPLGSPRRISEDALADLVEDAVQSRLVADVLVGIFLSGGLDSSLVAAIAAKHSPGISTFSMGFRSPEHDESDYAKHVTRLIDSTHHHFTFDCDRFVELLPKVAAALDEPLGDQATLPLYWLCQEASRYVKVALAGEGADEIFAGYSYYRAFSADPGLAAYVRYLFQKRRLPRTNDRFIQHATLVSPSGFPLLTNAAERATLIQEHADYPDNWERSLMQWLDSATDPLQRATAADLATWLPDDLLVKFDRMGMAHSLEGRAPFLMPGLVDAALRLPGDERMTKGTSKIALRRIARRWLPPDIVTRRKQGFVLPMREWITQWFALHGGAATYLSDRSIPGLNMGSLLRLIETDLIAGVQRERLLFALVMLFEWYVAARTRMARLSAEYCSASANCSW
jgi:asparagine synthase (glutamine-hydrolysing)